MNIDYEIINNLLVNFKNKINEIETKDSNEINQTLKDFLPVLNELSFENLCDWFEGVHKNLKDLIAERQKITSPWKTNVKAIEQKFLPVVKAIEEIKDECHKMITETVLENEEAYTNEEGELVCKKGNLCITEIEPNYEFTIKDVKAVSEEFLKPNEETIKTYIDCFGEAPEGIEMRKIRRCKIVTK